jgi:hypothetical protein
VAVERTVELLRVRDGVFDQGSYGRCGKNVLKAEYIWKVRPMKLTDDSDI